MPRTSGSPPHCGCASACGHISTSRCARRHGPGSPRCGRCSSTFPLTRAAGTSTTSSCSAPTCSSPRSLSWAPGPAMSACPPAPPGPARRRGSGTTGEPPSGCPWRRTASRSLSATKPKCLMPSAKPGGPVQPSSSVWRPLGTSEIQVTGGLWGQRQRLNADAILRHCETWMERAGWSGNFDRAAAGTIAGRHRGIEFVDSEVYKLLEAMAWELGRDRTAGLEDRYRVLAQRVAAAQEPDGYLHTSFGRPGQPARYSDLESGHELYCFGHLFQAAVARLRTGHDDLLPRVARRLADHVYDQFGPDGRVGVCGHPEIEMALAELARATGESRYLELARLLVERRGTGTLRGHPFGQQYFQDDLPVRAAVTLRGHAVRALYLAAGALDVATETSDDELA